MPEDVERRYRKLDRAFRFSLALLFGSAAFVLAISVSSLSNPSLLGLAGCVVGGILLYAAIGAAGSQELFDIEARPEREEIKRSDVATHAGT